MSGQRQAIQWTALLGASLACTSALELFGLPAALLLGPMIAAIVMATAEARVRVRRAPFLLAQGVVGCLIARGIPASVLGEIAKKWPLFVLGVSAVIAAASLLGYLLARFGVLPLNCDWPVAQSAHCRLHLTRSSRGL